jgi:hypothetical protein
LESQHCWKVSSLSQCRFGHMAVAHAMMHCEVLMKWCISCGVVVILMIWF